MEKFVQVRTPHVFDNSLIANLQNFVGFFNDDNFFKKIYFVSQLNDYPLILVLKIFRSANTSANILQLKLNFANNFANIPEQSDNIFTHISWMAIDYML
jgi:hypothetical protein